MLNYNGCLNFAIEIKYISRLYVIVLIITICTVSANSQGAVCTKTALQMGEKPAAGLNSAILYLMMAPFAIVGFIGYRWWKGNKKFEEEGS